MNWRTQQSADVGETDGETDVGAEGEAHQIWGKTDEEMGRWTWGLRGKPAEEVRARWSAEAGPVASRQRIDGQGPAGSRRRHVVAGGRVWRPAEAGVVGGGRV